MATKRMFNIKIVDSDAFLDMPLSTQCLYFHLNMRADDDGFVGNPKKIQRLVGASEDDLRLLIAKKFILTFENGVIVIKHWRMHNTLQNDRYQQTTYTDELKQLAIKDNKSYSLDKTKEYYIKSDNANKLITKCKQIVSTDIDKDIDIDKDNNNIDDINKSKPLKKEKKTKHKYGEYQNVLLTDDEYLTLKNEYHNCDELIKYLDEYIEMKGYKAKSHYLAIRKWVIDAVNKGNRYKSNENNGGLIF